ncbi:type II secretion system F family protein [Candidatus Micrarchaeota archaeon]|nr:type II secretion system F family protein [Candidatus Micrarchaeota archaeon]
MNSNEIKARLKEEYKKMEVYYEGTGFRFSFKKFIAVIFFIALATALIFLVLNLKPLIAVIGFIAVLSLIVSFPITLRNARISQIDSTLPDVLKHMSAVLKSGGTTESALEEAANSDYGPISVDLKVSLKQLREGREFDAVLTDAAKKTGSIIFKRCVTIILDARKAGAGLADVMNSIADDAKEILRVKRERYSRTTMHVMFLYISTLLLSPFIFGFSLSIVCYMGSGMIAATGQTTISVSNLLPQQKAAYCTSQKMVFNPSADACIPSPLDLSWLNLLLTVFLSAQAIVSLIAVGIIREGDPFKYILYVPIMVLFTILMFEGGKIFSDLIIGSSISCIM